MRKKRTGIETSKLRSQIRKFISDNEPVKRQDIFNKFSKISKFSIKQYLATLKGMNQVYSYRTKGSRYAYYTTSKLNNRKRLDYGFKDKVKGLIADSGIMSSREIINRFKHEPEYKVYNALKFLVKNKIIYKSRHKARLNNDRSSLYSCQKELVR